MQELFNQLDEANGLLKRALRKYLDASSAAQKFYDQASPGGIPPELSDRVTKEFSSLASFERKLKRIKSAIGQVRNHCYVVAPIHSLPSEIMNHIFSFVVGSRPCGAGKYCGETIKFPRYPDVLTYVCSRWRRIALNHPSLWSHIDVVPFLNLSRGFHARAKAIAARANLLDIHYYEPSFSRDYDGSSTHRLLRSIGSQIRSLELVAPTTSEYFTLDYVLAGCLAHSVAGVFDQLTIVNLGSDAPVFWLARDPEDSDDSDDSDMDDLSEPYHWLMISPGVLEETLLPLTVLHLDGVYFLWDHVAYHNLVELRLLLSHLPESDASITESELMNVLTHSPGLQVLHFDLPIRDELPDGTTVLPVHLEQLRTLSLSPRDPSVIGLVLRLLAPGQDALKLSLRLDNRNSQVYDEHLMKFFGRSKIEILRVNRVDGASPSHHTLFVDELIRPLRHLRVLVLQGLYMRPESGLGPTLGEDSAGPLPRLGMVYMMNCSVDVSLLRHVAQKYSPKTLTVWNTYARDGDKHLSPQELEAAFLSKTCQFVTIGGNRPNPAPYWD